MKKILWVISFLLLEVIGVSSEKTVKIQGITVEGLDKTDEAVIIDLLGVKPGEEVSEGKITEGITRIRNTRLFTDVDHQLLAAKPTENRILNVRAKDRWTTIPILKFSSGGGVQQVIAGIYDPNIGGRYFEAGAQYERLGSTNSGVAWLKKPRLFNLPLTIDLQLWNTNRLRTLYQQESDDLVIEDGFVQERRKLHFGVEYAIYDHLKMGVELSNYQDSYSLDLISDEVMAARPDLPAPETSTTRQAALTMQLGELHYNNHHVVGLQADYELKIANVEDSELQRKIQHDISIVGVQPINNSQAFAGRLILGQNNMVNEQQLYYLGGLDRIRGYTDNRFRTDRFALWNGEFRSVFYSQQNFVLQGIGFYDAVSLGGDGQNIASLDASSIGGGIRFIAPKIYRLVGRIDYAYALQKNDPQSISFGVQQFF